MKNSSAYLCKCTRPYQKSPSGLTDALLIWAETGECLISGRASSLVVAANTAIASAPWWNCARLLSPDLYLLVEPPVQHATIFVAFPFFFLSSRKRIQWQSHIPQREKLHSQASYCTCQMNTEYISMRQKIIILRAVGCILMRHTIQLGAYCGYYSHIWAF